MPDENSDSHYSMNSSRWELLPSSQPKPFKSFGE
jgi:hypothetical protein